MPFDSDDQRKAFFGKLASGTLGGGSKPRTLSSLKAQAKQNRTQRAKQSALEASQIMEPARDEAEARMMLKAWRFQRGAYGGRVLPPSPVKPGWRFQGFAEPLPAGATQDNMRNVVIPKSQFKAMKIRPSRIR